MFGGSKRRRAPVQPLTRETANPNAATAAASAFLRRDPSNSLSSAAAAAALRARPSTPTNVSQVQSKRAVRRSASVSSARSASRDSGRNELRRMSSSGSMTERTFRSPSPARSAAPDSHDVPPLPTIPKSDQFRSEPARSTHKRATSLQTQPMRTASEKQKDGHTSWFGPAVQGDMSNIRRSAVADKRVSLDLRPSSPNSINFSYPRSQLEPAESIGRSNSTTGSTLVYDPNSRRMVPRADLRQVEEDVLNASEKPVRRKKHDVARTGSHLSKGTVARPRGTAVQSSPASVSRSSPSPVTSESPIVQRHDTPHDESRYVSSIPEPEDESSELESEPESDPGSTSDRQPSVSMGEVPTGQEARPVASPPRFKRGDDGVASPSLDSPIKKKPSVVYEVPEQEQDESTQHSHCSQAFEDEAADATARVLSPLQTKRVEKVSGKVIETTQPRSQTPTETRTRNARRRVHSESPARTTHFAPTPDQLLVRHEPPPRSLSPRKSALKHSSPHRDVSPSEDGSDASGAFSSLASRDDGTLSRRKSARVSFDDQSSAVGNDTAEPPEVDSSASPTSQTKKPWHSIIGRHKRDSANLDEDEKMTPRPALPSFGSIREKKSRELSEPERPLVRPVERSLSPPVSAPQQSVIDQANMVPVEASSDFAISSAIAREQSSRNEANTSKYREPLPSVATSMMDSNQTVDSSLRSGEAIKPTQVRAPETELSETTSNSTSLQESSDDDSTPTSKDVPAISIIHPSPRVPDEQAESPQDFFDLPGEFPVDDVTVNSKTGGSVYDAIPSQTQPSESRQTSSKPIPAPITPQRSFDSTSIVSPSPQIHDIREESEESDGSSIYSDAYEDLSDMEGDGFMSLDAIVDSSVNPIVSQRVMEKANAQNKDKSTTTSQTTTRGNLLRTPSEWENAKVYWRSLSAQERRQLEKEALEDAGDIAELEETPRSKKPKKQQMKKRAVQQEDTASVEVLRLEQPIKEPTPAESDAVESDPSRVYQIQPGSTWSHNLTDSSPRDVPSKLSGPAKLRKSIRGGESNVMEKDNGVQSVALRKSMRSGNTAEPVSQNGHFPKSLRSGSELPAPAPSGMRKSLRANGSNSMTNSQLSGKTPRPESYQPSTGNEPVQSTRRNQSEERPVSSRGTGKPSLRRRGSDSSESSFRRARPSGGEGFGFRKSMRGNTQGPASPGSDGAKASSRFSLRSLSPTGSTFRRSTASPPPQLSTGLMRHSMRGGVGDGSSTAGSSTFGRSSKNRKVQENSRFEDSSDEEGSRPAFRSRFRDSSDDEEIPTPRPKGNGIVKTLRGTPSSSAAATAMRAPAIRTEHEDEGSDDVLDSDGEAKRLRSPLASNGNGTSASKNGSVLKRSGSGRDSLGARSPSEMATTQVGDIRPNHKRRGSFMSILRRKKDTKDKISRERHESAARRDTRLERSAEELDIIRSNSDSHAHNARLQKRGPNWPLREPDADDDISNNTYAADIDKRPSTAGGPAPRSFSSPTPKGLLKRRSTSQTVMSKPQYGQSDDASNASHIAPEGSDAGGSKKKKFGALRKMFGLND